MAKSQVSEPTVTTKFGIGDYVSDVSPHTQIPKKTIAAVELPGNWVKYYSRVVFGCF